MLNVARNIVFIALLAFVAVPPLLVLYGIATGKIKVSADSCGTAFQLAIDDCPPRAAKR